MKILNHSKNFLFFLTGEDPYIFENLKKRNQIGFILLGLIVLLIMILTTTSVFYGVEQLLIDFKYKDIASFVLSAYLSGTLFLWYLLMLYSLNRNVLMSDDYHKTTDRWHVKIMAGIIFIILGVFVAQPINYFLYKKDAQAFIDVQYQKEIEEYSHSENFSQKRLDEINFEWKNKSHFIDSVSYLMTTSTNNTFAWIVVFLMILILNSPIFLKSNLLKFSTKYYATKRRVELKLVNEHYQRYTETLKELMSKYEDRSQELFSKESLSLKTNYMDAPFNTIKKKDVQYQEHEEFLNWLWDEDN